MPLPPTKLPDVGTTIFTVMSKMAQEHGAINLSQGFPDFNPPSRLTDLLGQYTTRGYNQYPSMAGVPELREQIANKIRLLYGADPDPETEITVTSGATEALFVAIQTCITPGDEAIVLDPAYDAYDPAIRLAGGIPVHVPMTLPDFRPDWGRIERSITPRTRLIIVNTPHNPCGSTLSAEDLARLDIITLERNLFVLSDEVYEHMVYDGGSHHGLLTHDSLRRRSFVVSSFGKTYHATGWKVAYCAAPIALTEAFRKVHQFVTFTTHTPTQWAIAEFMQSDPQHCRELPAFYQKKRDLFLEEMAASRFRLTPSAGTYFQLADYGEISSMPDTEFARYLTTEVGVAAIPISVFYETPPKATFVRFCFCKEDATLREAAAKLRTLDRV